MRTARGFGRGAGAARDTTDGLQGVKASTNMQKRTRFHAKTIENRAFFDVLSPLSQQYNRRRAPQRPLQPEREL
jgi:hypothetical protein